MVEIAVYEVVSSQVLLIIVVVVVVSYNLRVDVVDEVIAVVNDRLVDEDVIAVLDALL